MESCNHDLNDIENPALPLAVSMKEELETLSPISSVCCIYGVSERLRLANKRVYTPQVVSIGPLHHGKESLKAMEEHEKRYLREFRRRTNLSLEHYIDIIKAKEARLRSSYAEPIEFSSDEFVKMVLVDAAFVVGVLQRNWSQEFQGEHDHSAFNKSWTFGCLKISCPSSSLRISWQQSLLIVLRDFLITELSLKFFSRLLVFDGEFANLESIYSPKVLHFVDLLRRSCLPLYKDPRAGGKLKKL